MLWIRYMFVVDYALLIGAWKTGSMPEKEQLVYRIISVRIGYRRLKSDP